MKITMLTESLGSGGAERQLCMLAVEMKHRGHDVRVITYASGDFYSGLLASAGIMHSCLGGHSSFQWLVRIRHYLRTNPTDVVVAFLESSANYAELAGLPLRKWGLVVSERYASPRFSKVKGMRKLLHLAADAVTTNSHTNRLILEATVPALKSRTITIYNAVDLQKFKPAAKTYNDNNIKLVTAARLNEQKNVLRAIEAIDLVRTRHKNLSVSIDWFGNSDDDRLIWRKCKEMIRERGLEAVFQLHEPVQDIIEHYHKADAVFLPSLYEGLPNTVCEGMACGKPILMSAVCDAGNLVKDGVNGYLFDPNDPIDISRVIEKFVALPQSTKRSMGETSRLMAEKIFDPKTFADMYESVLQAACMRKNALCKHWWPDVPDTAEFFVKNRKSKRE